MAHDIDRLTNRLGLVCKPLPCLIRADLYFDMNVVIRVRRH